MLKIAGWLMGGAGSALLTTGSTIAQTLATGWTAKQKMLTDQHGMDVKAATEITVEGYKADLRMAEINDVNVRADRTDKRMAWVRPAFSAVSFYWISCSVLLYTQPRLARALWIEGRDLPEPIMYLLVGIPIVLFGLRSFEKKWHGNTVIKMQENAANAQAQAPKPGIFARLTGRKEPQSGL